MWQQVTPSHTTATCCWTATGLRWPGRYRFLPKATQLRAAPIATRLRAACRQGLGANKVYLATLAVLGIALFFGMIIPASNTMLTKSGEVEVSPPTRWQ